MELAFPPAPEKKKLLALGGNKSKKSKWRKIDHNDIEDTASADVKQTILNRLTQQNQQFPNSHKTFFTLDAKGSKSFLSRSLRKNVTRLEKGTYELSKPQVRKIEKIKHSLTQRQRTLDQTSKQREAYTAACDLWDDDVNQNKNSVLKPVTTHPPTKQRTIFKPNQAPSIKIATSGQSINPLGDDLENLAISAAATVIEKERKEEEYKKRLTPVTSILGDVLSNELLEMLTGVQRQSVFVYYNRLIQQLKNNIAQDDDSLGSQLKEQLEAYTKNLLEQTTSDSSTHQLSSIPNNNNDDDVLPETCLTKKQPRKKTKTDRNRFERHKLLLMEAAAKKKLKLFNNAVHEIKNYLRDIEEKEEQQKIRFEYKKALREAKQAAEAGGDLIRFKSGKHYFEESQTDLILPSQISQAQGSLRKLKLSQIAGCALKDRLSSIYRRKLLEAPPVLDTANMVRMKKQANRKIKARRTLVKF